MENKPIKIGVSYENTTDLLVLQQLLNKLQHETVYKICASYPCRTGIIGSVKIHTTLFFSENDVDLAIFITDQDVPSERDDRFNTIIKSIEKVDPVYVLSSIVVLCNPHIEKWLISDHNAVKKVFGLDHDKPLPSASTPKGIIEACRNMQEEQLSRHEAYEALAQEINLNVVAKICPEFNTFCQNLTEKSGGRFILQ